MSRRFMAAAANYHRRQQLQQQHLHQLNDDDGSAASTALLHRQARHESPPSSPGGGGGTARSAVSAFPRLTTHSNWSHNENAAAKENTRNADVHTKTNEQDQESQKWVDQDPHVSSLAFSESPRASPTPQQQDMQQQPTQRFHATNESATQKAEEELKLEEGAVQFLPALSEQQALPGTSWEDEEEEEGNGNYSNHMAPQNTLSVSSFSSRRKQHVLEEKKESEALSSSNNKHMSSRSSVVSSSSSTMAFRARQYKHQRQKLRNQNSNNSQINGNRGDTNRAASVVSGARAPSSVASSLLHSAAQALRAKSPTTSNRPKSPSWQAAASDNPSHRPKSPLLFRPKSPVISRPKSPLASKSPTGFRRSTITTSDLLQEREPPLQPQLLHQKEDMLEHHSQIDDSNDMNDDNESHDSSDEPPPSQAQMGGGNRVSRLANMFGGGSTTRSSPPPMRPVSPYSRLRTPSNLKPQTTQPQHSPVPSSSGSSGYVGWPGTQDRRGKTVVLPQSSNEDSSSVGDRHSTVSFASSSLKSSTSRQQRHQLRRPLPTTPTSTAPKHTTQSSVVPATHMVTPSPAEKNDKDDFIAPADDSADMEGRRENVNDDEEVDVYDDDYVADALQQSSTTSPARQRRPRSLRPPSHHESTRRRILGGGGGGPPPQEDEPSQSLGHENNREEEEDDPFVSRNLRAAPQPSRSFALGGAKAGHTRNWGIRGHSGRSGGGGGGGTSSSTVSSSHDPPSSPSTAFSKTSSAYFNERDLNPLAYPDLQQPTFNPYGTGRSMSASAAASVLRSQQLQQHQPPTEEFLAEKDHLSPPHRAFSGSRGFSGLLDKTQEFPALMDNDTLGDSDTASSSRADTSASGRSGRESDVFDGISATETPDWTHLQQPHKFVRSNSRLKTANYPASIAEEEDDGIIQKPAPPLLPNNEKDNTKGHYSRPHNKGHDPSVPRDHEEPEQYKMVLLGGGLTAIQSSTMGYSNRQTPSDFDETLSNSEVESNGFVRTPSLAEMMHAGQNLKDTSLVMGSSKRFSSQSSSGDDEIDVHQSHQHGGGRHNHADDDGGSDGEVSHDEDPFNGGTSVFVPTRTNPLVQYYVEPSVMKKLLRVYRQWSDKRTRHMSLSEFELLEDENKAFALLEMRSRVMEKDMDRGLERRGGTVTVDDLVLTPYNKTAMRIRDAVIVAKAWRDGASPTDVTNTALLTRRSERTYFVRRPMQRNHHSSTSSVISGGMMNMSNQSRYYWEAVKWIDDTDFMLYRCPSLGPRNLRGFEMFTIGDCQSILLKLTNERCVELRAELNLATKQQIVAEEHMKEEEGDGDGFMTESEMEYLAAMEHVKTVSKQLVVAEQAFTLVRDRIEKLIAKYEALLVRIDNEGSVAGASSVVTYDESSIYSETQEEREAQIWARRARRAELKAEVAAREALMARQEADFIRQESQMELERVQQQLAELQSEASTAISRQQHQAVFHNFPHPSEKEDPAASQSTQIDKQKIDGVKQRFRDRMAAKKKQTHNHGFPPQPTSRSMPVKRHFQSNNRRPVVPPHLMRAAGEEMFSHLDFYERSLKAVQ